MSVSSLNSFKGSTQQNIGYLYIDYLAFQNTFCSLGPYLNSLSFLVSSIRAYILVLQLSKNLLQKLRNLRNPLTLIIFISTSYSKIALTFNSYIQIFLSQIIYLRKSTYCLQNLYLDSFTSKFTFYSFYRTLYIYFLYSFRVFKQIKILLKYTTIKLSKYFYKIQLIIVWKLVGVLVSLKGITKYLKYPRYILKVVFYLLPSLIQIKLYTPFKSKVVNYYIP